METAIPYHRPAAVRQIAFKVYLYYAIGFILSAFYIYIIVPRIWNSFSVSGTWEEIQFFLIGGFFFYLAGYALFGNATSVFRLSHFVNSYDISAFFVLLYLASE